MVDWNCCGATPAATVNPHAAPCLAARNLSIAEEMGMDNGRALRCLLQEPEQGQPRASTMTPT